MVYRNGSDMAITAMELSRTGNYGYNEGDDVQYVCPICQSDDPEYFYYRNGMYLGCSDCVTKSNILE